MSKGQRVGYIRVSSVDQSTERQLDGVTLDKTFTDKASGKDTNRPQLQAALDYVREGDTLVVHSMDRLARSTEDLLRLVRELTARSVSIEFMKENLTFSGTNSDPRSLLMMTMLGGFAQFERSLIRERQREGIEIAKAAGKYKGRKKALSPEQVTELRRRVDAGEAKATVARDFGISRETLYQYLSKDGWVAPDLRQIEREQEEAARWWKPGGEWKKPGPGKVLSATKRTGDKHGEAHTINVSRPHKQ